MSAQLSQIQTETTVSPTDPVSAITKHHSAKSIVATLACDGQRPRYNSRSKPRGDRDATSHNAAKIGIRRIFEADLGRG